ncbi:alpha/beta hydrolase [Terrihabitans rhizophilus]|uniref:Alpha/beta hydrolase n=1 Tax=Terrihabitans rhizophilus TaxID=3092662 RepID=A0ABU4RPT8_9HYPH|nr:alpha/beta hydrolase [Terrihabitans sp. PJ23]MDX6806837.1 alpha/beta hydrolase [Terrihabitans sp. PJ23]
MSFPNITTGPAQPRPKVRLMPCSPSSLLSGVVRRLSVVLIAGGLAAGCAGMASVNDSAATYPSDIGGSGELTAVTTRNAEGNALKRPWFGAQRSEPSIVRVRLASPHNAGRFSTAAVGLSDWKIEAVEPLPALRLAGGGTRDVLVYVHGFNETFESAALDAARLSDALTFRGSTVLFSWPSRNSVFDYMADRESAVWSRDALNDMLNSLMQDPGVGRVHIVAHSMGSMLTVEALRQVYSANRTAASRFGAIVFASPDIDVDGFSASVRRMGTMHRRMTVITALDDRALALSGSLAGGKRVGRAESAALEKLGIKVVDSSGGGGLLKHATFLRDAGVQKLVIQAIADARSGTGNQSPSPFPVFEPMQPVAQTPLASLPVPETAPAAAPPAVAAPAVAPAAVEIPAADPVAPAQVPVAQ